MHIVVLSRGPQLYSTQVLKRAGIRRGHRVLVVDHMRCDLYMESGELEIWYDGKPLSDVDAIIPRIGSSVTTHGAAVISHFEQMGIFSTARSQALLEARDKLRCLQKLAGYGVEIPRTAYVAGAWDVPDAVRLVGGFPVVIKLLESTHGVGVMLAETQANAETTVGAFQQLGERVIIQEYIREATGTDIRALVVAGKVVAAMKRVAQPGEFRSNLHRGAKGYRVRLTGREQELVLRVVDLMGLHVAGVDLLRSDRGPLVMEVNASPGLEGIESVTGVNVAGKIIEFVENWVKQQAASGVME